MCSCNREAMFRFSRINMFVLAAFILLTGLCETAVAETLTINSAINKAGRQRMLSQRMAKAYCQIGLNVEMERSKRILEQSVALFDKQLVELKVFAPTPEIQDTYGKLEKAWLEYKTILIGSDPNLEGGKKIAVLNEEVLNLAHEGTVLLEKYSGTTAGKLINISGRQRMLSQRMAKFYQFRTWGIASPQMAGELQTAASEFVSAQELLTNAPQNTEQITRELQLGKTQWFFFESALKGQDGANRSESMKNVATTSERILQVMDSVTKMYEAIPK